MDFDKSKENIQPLRGGRNVLQLTTALQAQSDGDAQKHLMLQKAEHEANIRDYVGPDPLEVWFTYIQWLEQSFPKHGHEGSIDKVLKTCLTEFENDPRYIQDRRFLRLWIKYIDYLSNPLELYQLLYNRGVGTTCSELYRAWACYCEEATDYKKADQVYNLGLQAHAQPIDELKQAHTTFQLWVAQRTLHNDSPTKRKAATALAETRSALTSLRTVKRRNISIVPSQRTGDNIRSIQPGVIRQQNAANSNSQQRSNIMVDVYQDKPGPSSSAAPYQSAGPEEPTGPAASILQSCMQEENQREVGIWTNHNPKSGKLGIASRPAAPLSFVPYEDDGVILSANHVPYCLEDFSDFKVPICVPDPPDTTKIPMYNKKEVYKETENGLQEFSLEEIRARRYIAAYKCSAAYKNKQNSNPQPSQNNHSRAMESSSHLNNTSALQTLANCALASEIENQYSTNLPSRRMESNAKIKSENDYPLNDMMSVPVSSEFNLENIIAQSNSILNAEDPHQSVVLEQNEGYIVEYIDMSKPQQYDNGDKADNMMVNEVPVEYNNVQDTENYSPKKSIYAEFNRSLLANVHEDSMTVNTREANREIDNVFASPVFAEDSHAPAPIVPQFEGLNFEIHNDHSMTMAAVLDKCANKARAGETGGNGEPAREFGGYMQRNNNTPNNQQMQNFNETLSTQMFYFDHKVSSTPNQTNQFKKPNYLDYNKPPNVKKFTLDDAEGENQENIAETNGIPNEKEGGEQARTETNAVDTNGLSVIMETTREHRSSSSSPGSYQTMRNTMFGYTREMSGPSLSVISEGSHREAELQPPYRRPHVQARAQPPAPAPAPTQPYHTMDHQYHKTAGYNGYPQRSVPQGYQNQAQMAPNGMYQQHQAGYQANYQTSPYTGYPTHQPAVPNNTQPGFTSPQQGFASPQQGFASPQQGFASPQQGFPSPQQGFPSPQQGFPSPQQGFTSPQQGFNSPQPGFTSPQHVYASPQRAYTNQHPSFHNSQHMYHNQSHQQAFASPHHPQAGFQSPPHAVPGYPSPHPGFQSPPQAYPTAQPPRMMHNSQQSYQHPLNRSQYANANQSHNYMHNQSYSMQNNSYTNQQKPQHVNAYNNYHNNQSQQPYLNYNKNVQNSNANIPQQQYPASNASNQMHQDYPNTSHTGMNTSHYHSQQQAHPHTPSYSEHSNHSQMYNQTPMQKQGHPTPSPVQAVNDSQLHKPPYQSPTSKLRSVRHEVPHITPKVPSASPAANPGFSNQFLNFISARNEPKDNANTPKFNNSPNISQKMHKNLYVSSPEQGQVPPIADLNASEISKENSSVRTSASGKNSIYNQSITDKQKDVSKRQLDFEHRTELQSEDSRDSVGKDSRMSSRQSVQSMNTDNFQMDVDSENSMDCQNMTFKSNCSNISLTTQDIPMPATVALPRIIDPFNSDLNNSLLQYVKFPNKNHIDGYYEMTRHVPKLQPTCVITLGSDRYGVEKQLGKGTFGYVYRGMDLTRNKPVALKYQKPGNPWEYYICKEIKARVNNPSMLFGFMDVEKAYIGDNASIFVSELSKYGSLLDVTNKVKAATAKCINELLVMLMAGEMLSIVHYLHRAQIIHADIKPDNFLLMTIPQTEWRSPSLQLIDLGCGIDMSLYPKGTTFTKVINTEGFTCTEMKEERSWTYQTDLYCLAGTIFLVLMGRYMQTVDCGGHWNVEKKWPRYMKAAIWDKLFITLLNIKDSNSMPDLMALKGMLDEHLRSEGSHAFSNHLNQFANVLNSR